MYFGPFSLELLHIRLDYTDVLYYEDDYVRQLGQFGPGGFSADLDAFISTINGFRKKKDYFKGKTKKLFVSVFHSLFMKHI